MQNNTVKITESKHLYILGLGEVGLSLLRLILNSNTFPAESITIIDSKKRVFRRLAEINAEHINHIKYKITIRNYKDFINNLKSGDILIDLIYASENTLMAEECLRNNIHYICTCDDLFKSKYNCFTYKNDFYKYKSLASKYIDRETCIIQFGMNPGMISIFVKKAINDIIEYDKGEYVTKNKEMLKEAIDAGDYAKVAMMLNIKSITETDIDSSVANIKIRKRSIYSTWNVQDFDTEYTALPTLYIGSSQTADEILSEYGLNGKNDVFYIDNSGYMVINKMSHTIMKNAYSPDGIFKASPVPHEEIISIHDFLSVKDKNGNCIYAPGVSFLYRPCQAAMQNITIKSKLVRFKLLRKKDLKDAAETVGVVVEGSNFRSRYVGNSLGMADTFHETPTILQVSISVHSALKYLLNHPNEGLLLPEYIDNDEILSYAQKHMKEIISTEI